MASVDSQNRWMLWLLPAFRKYYTFIDSVSMSCVSDAFISGPSS
ncbi:hypothetical protein T4B_2228 [Trichinella pseudospiralis]|uniref:Uncharacterized protein n=2 Tax=Trichinella pseudospiralis TaxID=6337 RepID=A0A0V1JGZ8_TRIPS|nr:hypothetical protein T4E_12354 [Trichinella pseudospiralis]KRY79388.1 hypothetical protein T4A_10302 [Trichinella pseudospiralis]KRY89540.1 hypothetical protein T4D_10617 [Trichinella pseudospiralis]KRZ34265.1 hypothetical protein T4B_2228 [Trichinella pseudospiralis]KRZ45859.1 hypothetical protein T4C_10805 [Trichinella pseudospiralis]